MTDEKKKGKIVIISGFSGAGKGTVVKKLMETFDNYKLSVSMTTRKPRENEEHGVNYFFVTNEEFEETIARDGLLEYARYGDHYYGTPRDYVEQNLESGNNVILESIIELTNMAAERDDTHLPKYHFERSKPGSINFEPSDLPCGVRPAMWLDLR
jgi:guanylate kinase